MENALADFARIFEEITPFSGTVPAGYSVDFLGTLTDCSFRSRIIDSTADASRHVQTRLPLVSDGETWFEAVDWVIAAQEARDHFVMVTLGAWYGAQAVGSYQVLQRINPMPCKLVAVEPEPTKRDWIARHMRDNAINPDNHWIVQAAISDTNEPVLFPVGAAGIGGHNCVSTNAPEMREALARRLIEEGGAIDAARSLLIWNSTEVRKLLIPGTDFIATLKLVSALTLRDLLGPLEEVDYLEADIQQSEAFVFAPFMDMLKRRVRRVHIGTHGKDAHFALSTLFRAAGWTIVFDYEPDSHYQTEFGAFSVNDGVLTARNPGL
jgi:hypothetical protein